MSPVGEDEGAHDVSRDVITMHDDVTSYMGSDVTSPYMGSDVIAVLQGKVAMLETDNASLRLQLERVRSPDEAPPPPLDAPPTDPQGGGCPQCHKLSLELKESQAECVKLITLKEKLEDQVAQLEDQLKRLMKEEEEEEGKKNKEEDEGKKKEEDKEEEEEEGKEMKEKKEEVGGEDMKQEIPFMKVEVEEAKKEKEEDSKQGTEATKKKKEEDLQILLDLCHKKLEVLEQENSNLKEECKASEREKAQLRANIRKVSANWFERKSKNSESENELRVRSVEEEEEEEEEGGSKAAFEANKEEILQTLREKVDAKVTLEELEGHPAQEILKKLKDIPRLLTEVSFQAYKAEITERMCRELRKRVKDYESVIDDQEDIIHGLKDQLGTYFGDNQRMAQQLTSLSKLFEDLAVSERTSVAFVESNEANSSSSTTTSSSTAPQLSLPNQEELTKMSSSVSKTYIKLKDLILEKKSLVTEIERLKVLNVELQRRVEQQESRLEGVSSALHATWLLVSNLKEEHARLHTAESILRYELKGKRELLQNLKEELECSRFQWHRIRQMNLESEEEWNKFRDELNERRRQAERQQNPHEEEEAQGQAASSSSSSSSAPPAAEPNKAFEPPVDLLLDMAIEYGVVDADDDTATGLVSALEGEDMHASRLRHLEDECCFLYQKLMASTSRSLTLASRLSALHQQYGDEDEDEDDEFEDQTDDEEDDDDDDDEGTDLPLHLLESDPESYDTAYISEDTGSASGVGLEEELPGQPQGAEMAEQTVTLEALEEEEYHNPEDDLSKRLINFLPRKIEILRRDNTRLEEKVNQILEERSKAEGQLKDELETERIVRKQLEEQLQHLGKCVDELKLERNGQIIEAEEKLKQKVASLSQREKEYTELESDLANLKDKFEERGNLLIIANERVGQLESALKNSENSSKESQNKLHLATQQASEVKSAHEQLNNEYKQLEKDMLTIQEQMVDLRYQLSSQAIEKEAFAKMEKEKDEQLAIRSSQVTTLEDQVTHLEEKVTALQSDLDKITGDLASETDNFKGVNKALQDTLEEERKQREDTENAIRGETKQLTEDNENLREKIMQLLRRRVRICDECFALQAEMASIIAVPAVQLTGEFGHASTSSTLHLPSTSTFQSPVGTLSSPTPATEETDQDEDFNFISEDEVKQCRLGSSPSSSSEEGSEESQNRSEGGQGRLEECQGSEKVQSALVTFLDLRERPPRDAEVWISAGRRYLVPVNLPKGVTLRWHFTSEPKSVSFSVLHQPQADEREEPRESQESDREFEKEESKIPQRVLIPTTRVASAQGAIVKGRLLTKVPGVYTLVFENSFARYTAKKVTYSLSLDEESASSLQDSFQSSLPK